MKRAKIKNKILIALVLIFGLSVNSYSVMIDVRTDEVWRAGYIEGAIHIPLSEIKKNKVFKDFSLVRQSRLSVMKVDLKYWKKICKMGKI